MEEFWPSHQRRLVFTWSYRRVFKHELPFKYHTTASQLDPDFELADPELEKKMHLLSPLEVDFVNFCVTVPVA